MSKTDKKISKTDKRMYVKTARELGYSDHVVRCIQNAQSERECEHILCNARIQAER